MVAAIRRAVCQLLTIAASVAWLSNESLASERVQQSTDVIRLESQQRLDRYRRTEDELSSLRKEFRRRADNFDSEFRSKEQAITWARDFKTRIVAVKSRINSYGAEEYIASAREEHISTITAMLSEMEALIRTLEGVQVGTPGRGFVIQYRNSDGRVGGNCGDGAAFSASFDGVYRTMPYGACAAKKGCESGATIDEAIRKACRE